MKVFVKHLKGGDIEAELPESALVLDLKRILSSCLKIEVSLLKLIFKGKVLAENNKKLSNYGVKDQTVLALMIIKVIGLIINVG